MGISKLCCPFCAHLLICFGYKFRGNHSCIKPTILSWNLPNYLDNEKAICFSEFLKSIIENQKEKIFHSDYLNYINVNDVSLVYKKCSHLNQNIIQKSISNFDSLLLKQENLLDDIKLFKIKYQGDLNQRNFLYYRFEWIFKVCFYIENLN